MALRLIEIYHTEGKAEEIDFLLKDLPIIGTWHDHLTEKETITKVILKSEHTESILDLLDRYYAEDKNLRVVILPVEATIPRPHEREEDTKEKKPAKSSRRISIEELYQKLITVSGISTKYVVMVVIASFVAAIGLLKNDVAIIIGSMVIAPLLTPNMALSLATTLADYNLARKAIVTNVIGFVIGILISLLMGFFMDVDPNIPQIAARSNVSHYYIFLALAAGVAGAYSITTGVAESLVGVMVAVALMPPLVAAGLLFGAAYWIDGMGALLLCLVNIVCVNLAGVITFIFEGIQPKKWWEAKRAQKAVRIAITVWIILLLILAIMIFFEQQIKLTVTGNV
jgi:uncharacterized hydrophobic protein (TIGR00341 family)